MGTRLRAAATAATVGACLFAAANDALAQQPAPAEPTPPMATAATTPAVPAPPQLQLPPQAADRPVTTTVAPVPEFGFLGALRIGHAFPMGQLADASTAGFADNVTAQTTVMFDIGLRWQRWVFGVYLGFGGGGVTDTQKAGFRQMGFDSDPGVFEFQPGLEAHYYVLDDGPVRPWVGLGTGIEAMMVSASQGSLNVSDDYTAWQIVRPMIGADFKITRGLGLGLFADASLAQFGSHTVSVDDTSKLDATGASTTLSRTDVTITNPAFHEWLTVGVRATLGSAW
jgi:hypothetical protein